MNADEELDVEAEDFISRGYQDELLKVCIEKNTIIYLPTGSGKTFIAIMAVKHFSKDLLEPISSGGKRSAFLANTKELAYQQAKCISESTALKTAVYTGDINVDVWDQERWRSEFEDNQVIVATSQILLDIIRHGYIKITDFNLIVFDECHNGRKQHPMHQLMSEFTKHPENELPRVIGLTGLLTSSSPKLQNVQEELEKLETIFRSTIATVKGTGAFDNVLLYSTCPEETIWVYETYEPCYLIRRILKRVDVLLMELEDWPIVGSQELEKLDKQKKLLQDLKYQIEDLGLYGSSLALLRVLVELELKVRGSETSIMKTLLRTLITQCEEMSHIITRCLDENDEMSDEDSDDENENRSLSKRTILSQSSPKVQALLKYLTEYVDHRDASQMKSLIFVHRRSSAMVLHHVINNYAIAANLPIRPDFKVGNNARQPESIRTILWSKQNRDVLERFQRNETNLIVASSVLEEGIDLQVCNLVISYDSPNSFRAYVQSKGRARMAESQYVLCTSSSNRNEMTRNADRWKKLQDKVRDILVEKAIDRAAPTDDDISKEFDFDLIEPFETPTGATLSHMSAISQLNRYCMSLPVDQFTTSAVILKKQTHSDGMISMSVQLPIQSMIRDEIMGDPMPNLKMAKRAVAVQACKMLYENEELNEDLKPFNKIKCLNNIHSLYFSHWNSPEFAKDNSELAGTKKTYRLHDLQTPDILIDSFPQVSKKCYLYPIIIKPSFTLPKKGENTQIFHELFDSQNTFGIVIAKQIPRLAAMKFFQTFGAIEVVIAEKPLEVTLKSVALRKLQQFHVTLFKDVLKTWQSFFVSDKKDSYIVAPINSEGILWDVVERFQQLTEMRVKTEDERLNVKYRPEEWLNRVVCKWYGSYSHERFVVTKVLEHLTPGSRFPNSVYSTYAEYFRDRYIEDKIDVMQPEQFLIEVKGITRKMNRLRPGDGENGEKKTSVRGAELLIPELCHNFDFPGDLWIKATVLPSALHRIHYLLHAEQLRIEINQYVGVNISHYQPLPVFEKNRKFCPEKDEQIKSPQITRPESNDTSPRILSDHASYIETCDYPWIASEEPIDLFRSLNCILPIEIDYYHSFITQQSQTLPKSLSPKRYQHAPPAICATPSSDKMRIALLQIDGHNCMRGIEQHELLAAITTKSSADVFDMERLEVLGDAFLKFGVSLYLIQKHTNWHEGYLTSIKGGIVSNRNLCYNGIKMNLPGRIKINQFCPEDDWLPPMAQVSKNIVAHMRNLDTTPQILLHLSATPEEFYSGEISGDYIGDFFSEIQHAGLCISDETDHKNTLQNFLGRQYVSDKTIADCVEAILGAGLKSYGVRKSFKMLEMFNILQMEQGNDITAMLDRKLSSPRIRTNISDREIDHFLPNYEELEKSIGYTFKDRAYLLQALTHPSYPTNRITGCYQQLEFLGDAVLDFLISTYIFERCPDMHPGMLTDLRSALVNNITLACLCVRYNLHYHILSQNSKLTETISRFTQFQAKRNHEITEHVYLLTAEGETQAKYAEYVDVPKTLGDVFEAIIGGVFLDSGNDLWATWNVVYRLMQKELEQFIEKVPINVVRQLYEMNDASPKFDKPTETGDVVLVNVTFTLNGQLCQLHGFGSNKRNAKRAAAKAALKRLKVPQYE